MTNAQIQNLITSLAAITQPNGITPVNLATILRAMQDFANSQQAVQPEQIQAVTELQAQLQTAITSLEQSKANASLLGQPNGIATLNESGLVPSTQLPSYVDDVIDYEKQVTGSSWLATALATAQGTVVWVATAASSLTGGTSSPYYRKFVRNTDNTEAGLEIIAPETGKIYICGVDSNAYRWSGSTLTEISKSLALGETASTAYAGNKGKKNAEDITALYQKMEQLLKDFDLMQEDIALIKQILEL